MTASGWVQPIRPMRSDPMTGRFARSSPIRPVPRYAGGCYEIFGDQSVPTATLFVFAARPAGARIVSTWSRTSLERHAGKILRLRAGKFRT